MEENNLILDASVILKWFLVESEDQEASERLMQDVAESKVSVHVPIHCFVEVMNILLLKSPAFATDVLSHLQLADIFEHRLNVECVAVARDIMQQFPKVAFYDAAYHALALLLGGTFVTADENYFKKTKKIGNICLLSDY